MDPQVCIAPPPQPTPAAKPAMVRGRKGVPIFWADRPHVYVRSGAHAGRSAVVVGAWFGRSDLLALAFFDKRGEPLHHPLRVDDLVSAERCELVIA